MFTEVVQDMLGKVPSVNFEKCYPSRLKNIFRKNYNYSTYYSFVPEAKSKIIGNLPHEIIELFDKSERAEKLKGVQKGLANTAKFIRAFYKQCKKDNVIQVSFSDLDPEELKLIEADMSKFLNKTLKGIVPKGVKAKLSFVDKGCWGNVFKMSFTRNGEKLMHDKTFKIFHNIQSPIKSLSKTQGCYAETNFWTFLKKVIGHKMDKTQFTRHYISDVDSGYAITEFVDKDIHPTTTPIDFERLFKIFYMDVSNVMINDKLYDVGGCTKFPNFVDDKVVLKYLKKLVHRNSDKDLKSLMDNLQTKIQNHKTPHRDKIQKALNLFDKYNEPLY